MPTRLTHVRLDYAPNTTPGTLYYECTRCGRKTKTYRKIKKHLYIVNSIFQSPAVQNPRETLRDRNGDTIAGCGFCMRLRFGVAADA